MRVSCIQICSGNNIKKNIKLSKRLILEAIKQKSDFILTPETSSLFGLKKKQLLQTATSMEKDIYLKSIKEVAKKYKKWILIGSLIIKLKNNKLVNRSVLITPAGSIKAYYDKMHMYDAILSNTERYLESKTFSSGKKIKTTNTPWGRLGLSICYDIRFPSMYRKMSKQGALFLTIPSAFTETTGIKHWQVLLRARAIENFCYIFAPGQAGTHFNGRKTFGNSLIVSPDGKILKQLGKKEGVITCDVDPELSKKLRKSIPSLHTE